MAVIILGSLCLILIWYIVRLNWQMRDMQKQLKERMEEQSQSIIHMEVNSKELNCLAVTMNAALKIEGDMRVHAEVKEKQFKEMITNISHDLRTPLAALKGYLQLLEQCGLTGKEHRYLTVCLRHTGELEKRVQQFFEYAYLLNKEDTPVLNRVNLTRLVMDAMTDFVPAFEENGLSMRFKGAQDGLYTDGKQSVFHCVGEESSLKRVMDNLLKNCLQYAVGEVEVIIEEGKETLGKCSRTVCVSIKNKMHQGKHPDVAKVFERFYLESTSRNSSTGLGLSIVKLLIEEMEGEVFARTEEDVFVTGFCLPMWEE